jgi:hypothetical protein
MNNAVPNNTISLEDIETNPELWKQKISVIFFNDKNGKNYWNKNYKVIPHWQRYNEAIKWIKDTEFPEYSCRIVKNVNNEIKIVTQNKFDKERLLEDREREIIKKIKQKVIVEINQSNDEDYEQELRKTLLCQDFEDYSKLLSANILFADELEELKRTEIAKGKLTKKDRNDASYDLLRPDLAIIWRKQLYFVKSIEYINNYRLSVNIWAKKCPLPNYYWSWMLRTRGEGCLEIAPNSLIKDSKKLMESSRRHYEFCDDLGIKRIYHDQMSSYQPKFSLFMAMIKPIKSSLTFSEQKTKTADGQEGKQLIIPSNIHLVKCKTRT